MRSPFTFSGPTVLVSRRRWFAKAGATAGGIAFTSLFGAKLAWSASPQTEQSPGSASADGVIHDAEAIRLELAIKASAGRVYEVLTNAAQFQKLQLLAPDPPSAELSAHPAQLSAEPGSDFSLFAGMIAGRQVELVPAKRVVQAWRVRYWDSGVYSIARFDLTDTNGSTKIVLDHRGFPAGAGGHLSAGWKSHYFDGLTKLFAT